MKRVVLYISALFLTMLSSCKPSPKEAAAFNDRVMSEQKKVVMAYDGLLETYDTYIARKMDSALLVFTSQTNKAIENVTDITPVKDGEILKVAVLEYLNVYKSVAENEADELVRLYKVPENEFTPELKAKWDLMYKDADTKLKEADKKLQAVQAVFAENFHLKLAK
ncbi:MAG: hypothetical protein II956_04660 [Bacteroidales bacterium]|nr:hypothetical protein [Bacteroidales bacterium]